MRIQVHDRWLGDIPAHRTFLIRRLYIIYMLASLCFKFIPTKVVLKKVKGIEVAGRVGTGITRSVPCFDCSLNKHSNFKTQQLLFSSIKVKTLISLITNVYPSACKLNYPASLRQITCYTERSRLGGNSLRNLLKLFPFNR